MSPRCLVTQLACAGKASEQNGKREVPSRAGAKGGAVAATGPSMYDQAMLYSRTTRYFYVNNNFIYIYIFFVHE